MKIHEQKWTQGGSKWSIRDAATGAERAHVFTDDQTASDADAVAVFIISAPKVTRALLALAPRTDDSDGLPCWCPSDDYAAHTAGCLKARRALRSAGVL